MLQFAKKFIASLKDWNIDYTCTNNVYSYNYDFENNLKVLAKHTVDEKNFAIIFSFNLTSLYCPTSKRLEILNFCNNWNNKSSNLYAVLCSNSNTLKLTTKLSFYDDVFPADTAFTIYNLYPEIMQQFHEQAIKSKIFNSELKPEILPSNPKKAKVKEKVSTKNLVFNMASNDISHLGYSFVAPPLQVDIKKK